MEHKHNLFGVEYKYSVYWLEKFIGMVSDSEAASATVFMSVVFFCSFSYLIHDHTFRITFKSHLHPMKKKKTKQKQNAHMSRKLFKK